MNAPDPDQLIMLVYRPGDREPTAFALAAAPSLAELQKAVGGYIEAVPWFDVIKHDGRARRCVAFRNEDGKLNGLPLNVAATERWAAACGGAVGDVLVGPVVVIVGDRALLEALAPLDRA